MEVVGRSVGKPLTGVLWVTAHEILVWEVLFLDCVPGTGSSI